MIKVKTIKPFTCDAYDPIGVWLGKLNEYEFNDLRIQIMEEQKEGYYMMFEDQKLEIDKTGMMKDSKWPHGFYDLSCNQLNTIFLNY